MEKCGMMRVVGKIYTTCEKLSALPRLFGRSLAISRPTAGRFRGVGAITKITTNSLYHNIVKFCLNVRIGFQ